MKVRKEYRKLGMSQGIHLKSIGQGEFGIRLRRMRTFRIEKDLGKSWGDFGRKRCGSREVERVCQEDTYREFGVRFLGIRKKCGFWGSGIRFMIMTSDTPWKEGAGE